MNTRISAAMRRVNELLESVLGAVGNVWVGRDESWQGRGSEERGTKSGSVGLGQTADHHLLLLNETVLVIHNAAQGVNAGGTLSTCTRNHAGDPR